MDRAAMDQLVMDHFMYEATDDVEGTLSTFTDDVQHFVAGSPTGPLSGKEAVRDFYVQLFADLRGEGVEPIRRFYGDDFLVDEVWWTGRLEDGRMLGLPGHSGHVRFRLLHVLQFRDGKISAENVWCDTADILAQTGTTASA